ncbi:MAG TPA: DUF58 domain-containing protein [Candidatus Limnocylindrales bacterium]|nr:DUF58 domain-containing protein [Candidatus Limnocylindrales bacterium]
MAGRAVLGVALVLAGAFLDVPIALALGVVTVGFELVRRPWLTSAIAGVGYRRHLSSRHVPWGEAATLTIEVWNRTRLPLSWLRSDDAISEHATVRERRLRPGDLADLILRNTWTLGPRELVRRRLHLGATRRGVVEIGPTELLVGDLFALPAGRSSWPGVDRLTVWPRTVPAPALARRERVGGTDRARRGLTEDPSRFVGVRDYQPGDPVRRLHARASVRLGRPMSKKFEPSRDRDVLLVVDLEPPDPADPASAHGPGPATAADGDPDEATESLIVIAASLVRSLGLAHAAFGLAAAGFMGPGRRITFLPVTAAPGQTERALDLLARLAAGPSASFDRLAGFVGRATREGTTILVLTGREASGLVRPLRLLQRQGHSVRLLASGPAAAEAARSARAAGLPAEVIELDGGWRTASRVVVAG